MRGEVRSTVVLCYILPRINKMLLLWDLPNQTGHLWDLSNQTGHGDLLTWLL